MNANANPIALAIAGAAGRMGQRLIALAAAMPQFHLAGAFEAPGNPAVGADSGLTAGIKPNGVPITDGFHSPAAVVIDFTAPAATRALIARCVDRDVSMVIGTTGLTGEDHALIDEAAKTIAVLQAPNTSLGVNLLLSLVARTAQQLGDDYDIEILEAHHHHKKDAPSGTALAIAESICKATGKSMSGDLVMERVGHDCVRERGKITMQSLRMGDVVGEHTAFFAGVGERLELTHKASSRDTFARGALKAAAWLSGKPAGRYGMKDVLGLAD
ncbi:MAG: 4-hydroxy-tetrahydrodipicolinate reductase [Planctomycetes bacterium]|nr:4-hydroxy-tetrahydrodipicolinate reductase [Planctomycetota bacterium]